MARPAGRRGRSRGEAAGAEQQVRGDAGHVDGPVRHHVPADHPRHLLPPGHVPLPALHDHRHLVPLAARPHRAAAGLHQPQVRRPHGQLLDEALLHWQEGPLRHVRR